VRFSTPPARVPPCGAGRAPAPVIAKRDGPAPHERWRIGAWQRVALIAPCAARRWPAMRGKSCSRRGTEMAGTGVREETMFARLELQLLERAEALVLA
jgi:hypothetical protein